MILFADMGVLIIAAIMSAALTLCFGMFGYLCGVICVWGMGIARIELLNGLDPQRDAAMLDAMWVIALGWIFGAIWCAPFLCIRIIYRCLFRQKTKAVDSAEDV